MNKIKKEDIQKSKEECQDVVEKVDAGYVFPPVPHYEPVIYSRVIQAAIPENVTISPPILYDFETSGAVTAQSLVTLGASIFSVAAIFL